MDDEKKFTKRFVNNKNESAETPHEIHQILEMANEAFISIDEESHIINWNPYAAWVFGWTKEEVLGQYLHELIIPQQYRESHKNGMARFLATGKGAVLEKTIEITALHKTRGEFPIELNIFSIKTGQTYTFHAFIRDITERKLVEEKSQKILEAAPDAIIITNEEGEIIFANTQTEKVFGFNKNELLGQKVEVLIPEPYRSKHPEHRHDFFNNPRTRPMGVGMELYGQRKNQEIFPLEISLSPLETKDGMVALASIRDITERKKAEKEIAALNQKLVTSARRAGMAEVANSILHNIGNILNSINVSTELIRSHSNKSNLAEGFKLITDIINDEHSLNEYLIQNKKGKLLPDYLKKLAEIASVERKNIVEEIQNLSKHVNFAIDIIMKQQSISGSSMILEKTSIEEILESALQMSVLLNQEITIKKYFDKICLLYTDKNKLLQILINLILNAKDALSASNNSNKCLTLSIKMARDNCIDIIVQDNGVGIPPDNLGHIFSFGFSTKKDGNGFGLHNSWLLAKELGGSIDVKSDGLGHGSSFTLTLPINKTDP